MMPAHTDTHTYVYTHRLTTHIAHRIIIIIRRIIIIITLIVIMIIIIK